MFNFEIYVVFSRDKSLKPFFDTCLRFVFRLPSVDDTAVPEFAVAFSITHGI